MPVPRGKPKTKNAQAGTRVSEVLPHPDAVVAENLAKLAICNFRILPQLSLPNPADN